MADNGIGDEGAKSMSEMLKSNTTLTTLNLGSEDEGVMEKRKERNDEKLTGNKIGVEGVKSMSETLKTNNTLASLNLCGEEEEREREKRKEK